MLSISGFLFCAVIIFLAGKRLSFYGDLIAEKAGLSKAWIGLILMALITSLPELTVGISSSSIVRSADLAVGDVLGSCTFNLAILAILDIFVPNGQHLFFVASSRHVLSASLSLVLLAMVGMGLYLHNPVPILPGIGIFSIAFLVVYLLSIRILYRFETVANSTGDIHGMTANESLSFRQLLLYYILYAFIIIGAALFIPYFAENIAEKTGLGNSFVGTVFVAASTSLPEIAVSIAAIRLGSIDLAIGNLLGSNIFNIVILVVDDIFYADGILLEDASDNHLVSVLSCIMMTAIAIAGFAYRAPQKRFLMAMDAALILVFYFFNLILLYYLMKS